MIYLVIETENIYGSKGYSDEGHTEKFISEDPVYGLVKKGDEFFNSLSDLTDYVSYSGHAITRAILEGAPDMTEGEFKIAYPGDDYDGYVDDCKADGGYLVGEGRVEAYDGYSSHSYTYVVKEISEEQAERYERIIEEYNKL